MDKTVKTFAYSEDDNGNSQITNLADDKNDSPEPAMKDAQFEEEKSHQPEHLKMIVQLRGCLKQEQEKNAELAEKVSDLQNQLNKLVSVEENQLFINNVQLEDEKKKSSEYLKTINELMENLKLEQTKSAEMKKKITIQETKAKELAEVLSTISNIAAGV
jgi:DNA repair exonuclease SbcCD ATPase subunit